ncbi:MAG: Gfo/Idh/MocA family oxidoreductase [Clostridia bacterium]|nr:Gfo/Idh/MocA family oxidoreductase [Clostridia bacterium]
MKDKVKLAVIGLGGRGLSMIKSVISKFEDVEIVAVCDLYPDRNEAAAAQVEELMGNKPVYSTDYNEILSREDVEAVYIATAWESHVEIAIAAQKAGKATALEVGGAYSCEELWELVHAHEATGTPFMLMENCCYNENELFATAAARSGILGRVVHCSGAYGHDLRSEIANGNINRHYRLRNYTLRNAENYPTHELGPIARLLNINRGNRMVSLVSVASGAFGMEQYIKDHPELVEQDPTLEGRRFNQGDVVNTIITCQNGETIALKLDTTLPRSYSREFTVKGTKGYYSQDTNTLFLDGMKEMWKAEKYLDAYAGNAKEYYEKYMPEVWLDMTEEKRKKGHGGMDAIMFRSFLDAYRAGGEMPIDVYDCAAWMSITALSADSIATGGMPQAIPDFTNGKWIIREPKDVMHLAPDRCGHTGFAIHEI